MNTLLVLLGATGIGGLMIIGLLWIARQTGYLDAKREEAEQSAQNLRERAKVDAEIRNLSPDDALRRFDGWLSDDKR